MFAARSSIGISSSRLGAGIGILGATFCETADGDAWGTRGDALVQDPTGLGSGAASAFDRKNGRLTLVPVPRRTGRGATKCPAIG